MDDIEREYRSLCNKNGVDFDADIFLFIADMIGDGTLPKDYLKRWK